MVAFAPTVPNPNVAATPDPEYTSYRWSRPIAPYEGNKSTAIAVEGAAKGLTETVNATDTLIKNHLEHSIEGDITPLRDERTAALEGNLAKIQAVNNPTPTNVDNAKKLDILSGPPKDDNVPAEIKGLSKTLETEVSRRDNGSVSDAYYKGRLAMIAKKYRTDWPGYTKEIDETVDRISERGVANDYIKSLTTDLNKYAESAKAEHNKYETVALEGAKSIAGFDNIVAQWKRGLLSDDQMLHKYNQGMSWKFDKEKAESDVAVAEAGTKMAGFAMRKYATAAIETPLKSALATVGSVLDRKGGLEGIQADIRDGKLDPVAGQKMALTLTALRDQGVMGARAEVMKNPKYQDLPEGELDKLINDNPVTKNFNTIISLLNGKENSLAVLALQLSKTQAEQDKWNMVSDTSDIGLVLRSLDSLKDIGDPATRKLLEGYVGDLTNLPGFVRKVQLRTATQGLGAPLEDKEVHTFNDSMNELIANKVKDPEVVHHLVDDSLTKITGPGTPDGVKLGFMQGFFNPKNLGNMEKFADDQRDPKTGQMIPGKFWLYRRITDAAVADEVDRVAKTQNNPKLRDQYSEYVAKEGQSLVSGIVPELENLMNNPYVSVAFDTEHQQFKITDTNYKWNPDKVKGVGLIEDLYDFHKSGAAHDIEAKLNQVLGSMSSMAKVTKQDPNALAYQFLSTMLPSNSKALSAIRASVKDSKDEE